MTHPTATARARDVSVVEIAHRPRDGTSLLAARIPSPDFVPFVRFGPGCATEEFSRSWR
jgi:hypothetical protein